MGKKKTYKLSEHEQQHNRVDYFRSIQTPKQNANEKEASEFSYKLPNQFTNPSFVTSNNDLTFSRTSNYPGQQPNVWTTPSYFPSEIANFKHIPKKGNKKFEVRRTKSSSNKKTRIIIGVIAIIIILVILAAIGLGLGYVYYWKPRQEHLKSCPEECVSNKYCVASLVKDSNSTCNCKPGFQLNNLTSNCEQSTCYTGYTPYTYLNSQSSQTPSAYQSKYTKPYCCPNSNYLTSGCCGMSTLNTSLTVSKRIIGGAALSPGVFPWIVYITQIYRKSPSQPIMQIKNCSGTLLNEMYVITAAHCLNVDSPFPFNNEFKSIESMIRVYVGFTDKSKIFQANVIGNYEKRIQKAIFHPKYQQATLKNDLAILKLDKPVYRDANTDYLCLFNYEQQDNIVSKLKLYTAGWGSTSPNHLSLSYPNQINYVDALVFPMSFCKYIYPDPAYDFLFNTTTHVCAGYQAAAGKDTCYADSGSPLMVQLKEQWFAYGIVTFGSQPDCAQGPSMFTRVSFYYEWIKSIINS